MEKALANALSLPDLGEGLGLFQALFFLGGGIGAALTSALLAARREGQADTLNPLYSLDAVPFSNVFLAIAVVVAVALLAALGLRNGVQAADEPASA